MRPVTRAELDAGRCTNPECTENHNTPILYLEAGCHPGQGLDARYVKASGTLDVKCHVCNVLVVRVAVATRLLT